MKMGNFGTDITGNLGQRVEFKYLFKNMHGQKETMDRNYLKKIVLNKQYLFESWSSLMKFHRLYA